MLGRLQMTVAECIASFIKFGDDTLGTHGRYTTTRLSCLGSQNIAKTSHTKPFKMWLMNMYPLTKRTAVDNSILLRR